MAKKKSTYDRFMGWVREHGDVTTDEEQKFYNALPDSLKSQCVRQKTVVEHGKVYYLDFYFFYSHLCVELDGKIHLKRKAHDRQRDQFLLSKGIKTLRFTNEQINDKQTLERIIRYLEQNYT